MEISKRVSKFLRMFELLLRECKGKTWKFLALAALAFYSFRNLYYLLCNLIFFFRVRICLCMIEKRDWLNFHTHANEIWKLPGKSLLKYLVRNRFLAGPKSIPDSLSAEMVKLVGLSESESDSAEWGRSKSPTADLITWLGVMTRLVGSSSS